MKASCVSSLLITSCVFVFIVAIGYTQWKWVTMPIEKRMEMIAAKLAVAQSGDIIILTNDVTCIITSNARSSMTLMTPSGLVTQDIATVITSTYEVIGSNSGNGERIRSAAIKFTQQFMPGQQHVPAFP